MSADVSHGWAVLRLDFEERSILADVLAVRIAVGEGVESKLIDPAGFRHRSDVLRRIALRLARAQTEFGRLPGTDPFLDDHPTAGSPEDDSDPGEPREGP